MRQRLQRRSLFCGATFVLVLSALSLDVRGQAGKRPLTYDVYDSWKSIQGTTLSRDGQWLAYAVTAQGVDGELIVRNLQSGQEYRHPRGINPEITPDGNFIVCTIAAVEGDEERQREQERRAGAGGQGRGAEAQGEGTRAPVRTSAGLMTLATGQVATVERVGSVRLPEEASTWVALYRGAGEKGVPYLEKGKRDVSDLFKPKDAPRTNRQRGALTVHCQNCQDWQDRQDCRIGFLK